MRLVFDIEANGLYDEADTIWCICAKDIDTGETYEWHTTQQSKLSEESAQRESYTKLHLKTSNKYYNQCTWNFITQAKELIGHNIINYDLPLLKKLWNWTPDESTKITDTLVMSRLANPDRAKPSGYPGKGGPHSLEAWGYRVGKGKLDHEDWSIFSPAMLRRCRADVEINYLVYHSVSRELEDFSDESIQLEHGFAPIITDQEHHGILFDVPRALEYVEELTKKIQAIDEEIVPRLPRTLEILGVPILKPFLQTGGYRKQTQQYIEEAYVGQTNPVAGPFTRIKYVDFDLGSTEKVKRYLLDNGWEPDSWNFSKTTGERTSPKLEGSFRGVDGEIPRRVKERITWRHRRSQIEGWLKHVRTDNTIPAGANTNGTNTGRMRHSIVVNIPKANHYKETGDLIWETDHQKDIYGTQMRSLFIPREGYKLIGHDAAGLELRMLAHYMNDPEFTREVISGDIHSFNQRKANLPTRDAAKTFIYALIYGAGDAKIGNIIGGTADDGAKIKSEYFRALPRLKKFIESVKRASGRGWLRGLDGRRVYMRRDAQGRIARSKAVNTLLQHAGSIVMKKSCVILWDEVKRAQIDAHKVLDMHDEGQSEVKDDPKIIEQYCNLAVNSIIQAGEYFKLNVPLAAECKVGNNMAETH